MEAREIRQRYIAFFENRGHRKIHPAPLVLENDPTTLFTSSGMQPLVSYLKGELPHPAGRKLVNSQPCFRAEDIEEVGDNRHTTFFEMLGNWSLGDYWKKEQLTHVWTFLTEELRFSAKKLHVTIYDGDEKLKSKRKSGVFQPVGPDVESKSIWLDLGVPENQIHWYGSEKNWWSRSGPPEDMNPGDIGGPDSEVFYDFGGELQVHEKSQYRDQPCHPNCGCGRFMEIGNSVFIHYRKREDGSLEEFPQKNIDFGGGLERLTAATISNPDIFAIDLFKGATEVLREHGVPTGKDGMKAVRIILDHMRAATFLISAGVTPSNKVQGYMLRRLIRKSAVYAKIAHINLDSSIPLLVREFEKVYEGLYFQDNRTGISEIIAEELDKFNETLERGLKEITSRQAIGGKEAFDFYQTYGFPLELTEELARERGLAINRDDFQAEFEKHKELSRSASAGMFKGGLASSGEIETKYHTVTHLLHQALRDVLGPIVLQKGSNITQERLRFDFSYPEKLTEDQLRKVESIVNATIQQDLPVRREEMIVAEAKRLGALGVFDERYGEKVSVYTIGDYSKEICGGPHVSRTGEIGDIEILKEEGISHGVRRIRAILRSRD